MIGKNDVKKLVLARLDSWRISKHNSRYKLSKKRIENLIEYCCELYERDKND